MDGFLTVGQPAAVTAVHAMLGSRVPHAVLLVGPASVGKHQLAMDLAAGLLCTGASGGDRPCRTCRTCRMVEHGNHPDLHTLGPIGAGGQVVIGGEETDKRGVRDLVAELALLPVEGGERVAIIREAHRMNEHAQSAILKTLEEPPSATTLILVADDEELLLPTIRSRCARIRLGTVGPRAIEQLLGAAGLADAPTAARLARLGGGRPGVAMAYAAAPEAEAVRAEIVRTLLDLMRKGRSERLVAAKTLQGRALDLARLLEPPVGDDAPAAAGPKRGKGKGKAVAVAAADTDAGDASADRTSGGSGEGSGEGAAAGDGEGSGGAKATAADRRRGLALLIELWRDLARDLACVQRGAPRAVRDTALLEELEAAAKGLQPGAATAALARLVRASEMLAVNTTPELILDVLLVRWPVARRAA